MNQRIFAMSSFDVPALKVRLAQILYKKSYLAGDFTLTSGRKSDYYFDCRQSSLHPEGVTLMGSIFFAMLSAKNIQAVAGMTMGADPLVTATSVIAYQKGVYLPALIVRKEAKCHGTARLVEGLANITKGQRVIVLEDVVSTGGSVIKACKKVEATGLIVAGIFCILDRDEGGTEAIYGAGYELNTIFTRAELLSLAKHT